MKKRTLCLLLTGCILLGLLPMAAFATNEWENFSIEMSDNASAAHYHHGTA